MPKRKAENGQPMNGTRKGPPGILMTWISTTSRLRMLQLNLGVISFFEEVTILVRETGMLPGMVGKQSWCVRFCGGVGQEANFSWRLLKTFRQGHSYLCNCGKPLRSRGALPHPGRRMPCSAMAAAGFASRGDRERAQRQPRIASATPERSGREFSAKTVLHTPSGHGRPHRYPMCAVLIIL